MLTVSYRIFATGLALIALTNVITASNAYAAENQNFSDTDASDTRRSDTPVTVTKSTRPADSGPEKRYGVYASIGNPYPTLLGINAAYNFTNNLRASVGYGEVEATTSLTFNEGSLVAEKISATTYAAGAEYLFLTTDVRPLVGLHAGYFDVKGKGEIEINGFNKSTAYLYTNAGIDWIGPNGFQMGVGMNFALGKFNDLLNPLI